MCVRENLDTNLDQEYSWIIKQTMYNSLTIIQLIFKFSSSLRRAQSSSSF